MIHRLGGTIPNSVTSALHWVNPDQHGSRGQNIPSDGYQVFRGRREDVATFPRDHHHILDTNS
ncbi:MAG TPA: hypothetical protein VJS37_10045, partial [Terriglobales bacterium]|nr:hypothetical protein [Terriglobales bacterium]